jgi:hypothetical protein
MLSIVLFLILNESKECLDSEFVWCHLGTFEHFALFKMASKMAASSNKHSECGFLCRTIYAFYKKNWNTYKQDGRKMWYSNDSVVRLPWYMYNETSQIRSSLNIFSSPCWTFLCKGSLTKPATPLYRPFLLVPVLFGLKKFHCTYILDMEDHTYKIHIIILPIINRNSEYNNQ